MPSSKRFFSCRFNILATFSAPGTVAVWKAQNPGRRSNRQPTNGIGTLPPVLSLLMNVVFSVILLSGSFYLIWWGYKYLLKREKEGPSETIDGALCHLCRQAYPKESLVVREKMGGFENYFCGMCIEDLKRDYDQLVLEGKAPIILPEVSVN